MRQVYRSAVFPVCHTRASALAVVTKTSPSPQLFVIRPIYRPADNKLDIAAVERDPYRRRIQLVVRSSDRRPHQFSAYSIQQNDAKGIVDFVLQRAGFCEYIIVFGTLCYKWQYAFLLVMNLFDTDVCVKALKGNSLKGENVGFFW